MNAPDPTDEAHTRAYDEAFGLVLDALARDDTRPLDAQFTKLGLAAPRVVWNPATDALPDATLRATHAYWNRIRGAREMPDWGDLHVEVLGIDVVHLAVVDPVRDAVDFRFAVYGSAVSNVAMRDYRGETVRGMGLRAGTPGPMLYRAVYALVRQRRVPAFTWNVAPPWQEVEAWNRLVLPFAFADGELRFLVCLKGEGSRQVGESAAREGAARLATDP